MKAKSGWTIGAWTSALLVLSLLLAQSTLAAPIKQAGPAGEAPQAFGKLAVVGATGAEVYGTPGGAVVRALAPGTILTALGRNMDQTWLWVQPADGSAGWVRPAEIILFDVQDLAVVDADSPSSQAATEPAIATPAVTLEAEPQEENGLSTPPEASSSSDSSVVTATVTLTDARLNVRAGPGLTYAILGKAMPGDAYEAQARDETGEWIRIQQEGSLTGWVAAEYVTLTAPLDALEVADAPDPPPATPVASVAPVDATRPTAGAAVSGLHGTLAIQTRAGGDIYMHHLDTGVLRRLTHGFDPSISPDGSQLAFTRDGGENGIYLIGIDGDNERRIFSGLQTLRSPSWSPDGAYIVFSYATEGDLCREVQPGFCAPDLPQFADAPLVPQMDYVLGRVDVNGQNFGSVPALNSASGANWSDGGIVYASRDGIEMTQDAPGVTTANLLHDTYYYLDPTWQPGGDRILVQRREGSHWEIYAVGTDGSDLHGLTRPSTVLVDQLPSNVAPAWSPDGASIIFLSNRTESGEAGVWRLWVMDADGGNQRPLSLDLSFEYSFVGEQMVSWGPG